MLKQFKGNSTCHLVKVRNHKYQTTQQRVKLSVLSDHLSLDIGWPQLCIQWTTTLEWPAGCDP